MINILSVGCGLQFAPYLIECASAFLGGGPPVSRVVRQGGSGLIVRSDDGINLRYQNREAHLGEPEARHYLATLQFRSEFYDVVRTSDEVVFANVGRDLLLSHPQSDLWLDAAAVRRLVAASSAAPDASGGDDRAGLPEHLSISTGAGRLLISDQRNGRWVLLGSDHARELERRLEGLKSGGERRAPSAPPTVMIKGLRVHLQSAFNLAGTLERFAEAGDFTAYEEAAPAFSLSVRRATEGIELRDGDVRVALTRNEARKWAAIIRNELSLLNAGQTNRGRIRTVFADGEGGRWVLQWGDEVFVPAPAGAGESAGASTIKRADEFTLFLDEAMGACVALTESEARRLID